VRAPRLRADLSLIREGADVAIGFGVRSLEGLGDVAELLHHAVYEKGSLRVSEDGISFTIRNPPLRMGAFRSFQVAVDGMWVPPPNGWVHPGGAPAALTFAQIDRDHPVTLPIGVRTRFLLRSVDRTPRRIRVRLELRSVAIPPLVWYEFVDELRPVGAAL
jgi:hypothetical protein